MIYPPRNAAYELERLAAKLEAAERDTALKEKIIDSLGAELNAVANERDGLLDCLNEWKALAKSAEKERDDLLEALTGMLACWRTVCRAQGWEPEHLVEAIRAQEVIAKATGEQS